MGFHWGKCVKIFESGTTGEVENGVFGGGRAGKTRLAKGYLGLQGSDDETGAMDESEKSLPCGEDVGSDCRRFEAQSVNLAFESL